MAATADARRRVRPEHHDARKVLASLTAERLQVSAGPAAEPDERHRPDGDACRRGRDRRHPNRAARLRTPTGAAASSGSPSATGTRSTARPGTPRATEPVGIESDLDLAPVAPESDPEVHPPRAARAAQAAASPARSDSGRAAVNQKSGLQTVSSVGDGGAAAAPVPLPRRVSRRKNTKKSSGSTPAASALHIASPRTSGIATPARASTDVPTFPSAMKIG